MLVLCAILFQQKYNNEFVTFLVHKLWFVKKKQFFCVKEKILKLDEIRNIIIYIEYTK